MFVCSKKWSLRRLLIVHGNYDELLQLSNVVAFNDNDDYNKQIAVRENDIVYIPAPVTQKLW